MKKNISNVSENEINIFYKTISNNVKLIRKSQNITQLDLALDIGIKSVAFYSNCENNRYNKHFNLEHLYKIAKALHVNVKDFLLGNTREKLDILTLSEKVTQN